jgi:hypothetical protein
MKLHVAGNGKYAVDKALNAKPEGAARNYLDLPNLLSTALMTRTRFKQQYNLLLK